MDPRMLQLIRFAIATALSLAAAALKQPARATIFASFEWPPDSILEEENVLIASVLSPQLTALSQHTNKLAFPSCTEAVVYPEEPSKIFVACRGGGLTVVDVSNMSHPAAPLVYKRWQHRYPCEGQDRLGDTFVLAEVGSLS